MQPKTSDIKILKTLKEHLVEHFGENIQNVILFGSRSKSMDTEFSDFDVLIILKNDYDWKLRDKMTDIIYDLELEYDVLFDKHLLSINEKENLLKGAEPIYINAIKKGIYA